MKVIFVTYDLPYPLTSGGKIRAYHLLKGLCQDHEVTLFSYYRDEDQVKYVSELKKELGLKEIRLYERRRVWDLRNLFIAAFSRLPLLSVSYLQPELKSDLLKAKSQWLEAIFHFEAFGPAVYLPLVKKQLAISNERLAILGNENIEWQVYQRIIERRKFFWPLKLLMRYDVWKMRRFENELYKLADVNLGVSEGDCNYVKKITGKECYLVKNGVEINSLKIKEQKAKMEKGKTSTIAFGGDLSYQQNAEGLKWFLEKVLPHLVNDTRLFGDKTVQAIDKLQLNVVSLTNPSWLKEFSLANQLAKVKLYDDADTKAPEIYAQADVFIAPLRVSGGTQIKVLEAMAVKTSVVATSLVANALHAEHGKHLLVADTPEAFARSITDLLTQTPLRDKITANAYEFVVKNYSWKDQAKKLREVYSSGILSSHRHLSAH